MSARRQFLQSSVALASLLVLGTLGRPSLALAEPAASQFRTLGQAQPTDGSGKIEVLEFFWYECPHCNEFEPTLDAWEKRLPKDVMLKRVPVAFRDDFTDQQRLFYTLEALGRLNDLHVKVFQEIHVNGNRMRKADQFAVWAEKQGIDKKKFYDVFQSFSVQSKVNQAKSLANAYKIDSVPMLAVDGQFTTSASIAGGTHAGALQVVDFLIDKTRKAKSPKKS